jgi:hypothetical protein
MEADGGRRLWRWVVGDAVADNDVDAGVRLSWL